MTKKILTISMFVGLVFVLAGCGVTITETTTNDSDATLTEEVVDLVGKSVVSVECYDGTNDEYSWGSGVVWNSIGDVITNNHVIPQDETYILADYCLVYFPDMDTGEVSEIFYAEPYVLEGVSEEYDLALLEISEEYIDEDGLTYGDVNQTFPEITLETCPEEGTAIKLGEKVVVLGYPDYTGGYSLTISEGVVSSFYEDGTISTTAQIDAGNSGGLAVDSVGCMLGVPSSVYLGEYENIGGIIPASIVSDFLDQVYVE